jgi:hypothetical protein
MSLLPLGISIGVAASLDLLNPTLFNVRSIGGFIADCTVEEQHLDELAITEHPVEQGAAITDHAFKRPASVIIHAGFSNASPQGLGDPDYVNETYADFLNLQASRKTFDITTGKRSYSNMLISRLSTQTDEKTANAMILTVECREIIQVATQAVTVPSAANMASPEITGATVGKGTQAAVPVSGP